MVDTRGLVRLQMPCSKKPTMDELNQFNTKYCELWRPIGYKLGLQDEVLNVIQSDHPMQTRECFRETLQKWLMQDETASWGALELAITNAHRDELSLQNLTQMPLQQADGQPSEKLQKDDESQPKVEENLLLSPDHLSVHFSSFLKTVSDLLERCKDKLEACKVICSNLTISGNSDVLLFNNERLVKINECVSFKELFALLRQHWSWKEYSILKAFVTESDLKEAIAELEKFEKLMGAFWGMKLISDKCSPSELPVDYIRLCIIVDKAYKALTLQDYNDLKTFIFNHLQVHKYIALPFIKFLFSSLHLEWYIPVQAASHIIKMANQNKKVLAENLIILIQVGDKNVMNAQEKSLTDTEELGKVNSSSKFIESPFSTGEKSYCSMLTCPLCQHLFKSTRYLPCYHFYCEDCLEKVLRHSKVVCPECKEEAAIPTEGVKNLPSNCFFDNLALELILKHKVEAKTEVVKCEDCNTISPVVAFCSDCALFLCDYCQKSHCSSKSCCSHNVALLTEIQSNQDLIQLKKKEALICHEHNLKFDCYCETCQELVCEDCRGEHKDHRYDTVKKFAGKFRNKLRKATSVMENVMLKSLSKAHDHIDRIKGTTKQQGDNLSKEIDRYYDNVVQKLLEQKEKLKKQVQFTVSQKEQALVEQLSEVKHTQAAVSNIKRLNDSIVKTRSDEEALLVMNQMTMLMLRLNDAYEMLNTCPVESANVKVSFVKTPLPKFAKHFTTIDSLTYEVENPVETIQLGQMATLEVITKKNNGEYHHIGGSRVSVQLESSSSEVIATFVADNDNGTYTVNFKAQQTGEIRVSVFANGRQIVGSPYAISVLEHQTPSDNPITGGKDQLPWSIACSENGIWAVADWTKNCIHLYDKQNQYICKFGSQGNDDGQFQYPCGVAFDIDNNLYVTDSHNHRVQKFDIFGNYLLQFGHKGSGKGELNYPVGVKAHDGKVYIADRQNNRVSVFQSDGQFCRFIGEERLSRYFDVTINNNQVNIADWSNHCIYTFTMDGHYCGMLVTKVHRKYM